MADAPRPPTPRDTVLNLSHRRASSQHSDSADQQQHKRPRAALTAGMNNPPSRVQQPRSCSTRNTPEISSEIGVDRAPPPPPMDVPPGFSPLPRSRAPLPPAMAGANVRVGSASGASPAMLTPREELGAGNNNRWTDHPPGFRPLPKSHSVQAVGTSSPRMDHHPRFGPLPGLLACAPPPKSERDADVGSSSARTTALRPATEDSGMISRRSAELTIKQNDVVVKNPLNGLMDAVKKLETIKASGKRPRGHPACLGHEPIEEVPLRFYVQVSTQELHAVVIPPAFRDVLAMQNNMGDPPSPSSKNESKSPRVSLAIRCSDSCEYFVQLQWLSGELVLLNGWKDFADELHLSVGDILVCQYQGKAFKLKHFQFNSSTEAVHFCSPH